MIATGAAPPTLRANTWVILYEPAHPTPILTPWRTILDGNLVSKSGSLPSYFPLDLNNPVFLHVVRSIKTPSGSAIA